MPLLDDLIACQCQIPALADIYPDRFGDQPGRFVEVGAFNGYQWSNVWPLVNAGWSGLMFEPFPEFAAQCRERYQGNPRIEIEQCAIADKCGPIKLFAGGSMTTIEEGLIDVWAKVPGLPAISRDNPLECEAHTLDCRFKAHDWTLDFDLLSIDAEGADDRVLMGFDLTMYRPKMIIVELDTLTQNPIIAPRVKWVQTHLTGSGYECIYTDAINSIYWRAA